jgi:hypothetical protein
MSSSIDVPTLQKSTYVLKHYSLGCSRIPLEGMAIAYFNRGGDGVNGRHAQANFRRINDEEGFHVWRYRRGLCIQPDPADPLRHAIFTNQKVAKQRTLLAEVQERPLPGCFAKTHLWHALLTAKVGNKLYHDSGLPMVANESDEELQLTLTEGMWFETLRHTAHIEEKEGVEALMRGDNFDASFAMAATEIALIQSYFRSCRITVARPGESQWEAVRKQVAIGCSFSDEFKLAAYNFSKVIGEAQMALIADAFQAFVDPVEQMIGQSMLTIVTQLPSTALWLKAAFCITNLWPDSNNRS